jgi:hypothetical protein
MIRVHGSANRYQDGVITDDTSLPLTCVWTFCHTAVYQIWSPLRNTRRPVNHNVRRMITWWSPMKHDTYWLRNYCTFKCQRSFFHCCFFFGQKTFCSMKQSPSWEANISHETTICNNPLTHRRQKTTWQILIGPVRMYITFLRKNKGKKFLWAHFHRRCVCNPPAQ